MIQPDSQRHAKFIRIRPYKPSDSEQVRELFKASTVDGGMFQTTHMSILPKF